MQFIAYLNFNGNCRPAFDAYRDVLKGKLTMSLTYGDSPMRDEMPSDSHGLIAHCQLEANGAILMGADGMESLDTTTHQAPASQGMCVNIVVDTPEEAERIFHALSADGEVQMPLQETFWAQRWATFTDRFGTPWMINCLKLQD